MYTDKTVPGGVLFAELPCTIQINSNDSQAWWSDCSSSCRKEGTASIYTAEAWEQLTDAQKETPCNLYSNEQKSAVSSIRTHTTLSLEVTIIPTGMVVISLPKFIRKQ